MHAETKKCADSGDIKALRYIFVDCLDVDPTFEKYKEDYEYCKNVPGLFDAYQEMNGLISDEALWDKKYWEQLKVDLMKNFSRKRFEHMIKVAKVVYSEKVARLIKERSIGTSNIQRENKRVVAPKVNVKSSESSISEEDMVKIEKKKKECEANYKRDEEKIRKDREELVAAKKEASRKEKEEKEREEKMAKKNKGIVLLVSIIVIVILIKLIK